MEPSRIPKVMIGLTLFWGFISSVFFFDRGFYFPAIPMTIAGVLLALLIAELRTNEYRENILKKLKYDFKKKLPISDFKAFASVEKGVFSSLGPVPFNPPQFRSNEEFSVDLLYPHYVESLKRDGINHDYISTYLNSNIKAGYKNLFIEICKVFLHDKNIGMPAGFKGRHGNTSLIAHSIIVCHLAAMEAKKYQYESLNFIKKNKEFQIDPQDPLLPILGMAHDIGKILTFVRNDQGVIEGYSDYHTNMGARMIVQLPSYWNTDLTNEDRHIIQTVLTFYHTPQRTPAEKNIDRKTGASLKEKIVSSDRLHALMDVVIIADKVASMVAQGKSYQQATIVASSLESEFESGNYRSLKKTFYNFLLSPYFHVNSRKGQRSVAFKFNLPDLTGGKTYLFFDSKEFSLAFINYWKSLVESSSDKDFIESLGEYNNKKINPFTRIFMSELLSQGRLVDLLPTGKEISKNEIDRRLFKVVLGDPKSKTETITMSSAFVMNIEGSEELESFTRLNNNHSTPISVTPLFSRQTNGRIGHEDLIGKAALEKLSGEKTEDMSVLALIPKQETISTDDFKALVESWINPGKGSMEFSPGISIGTYVKEDEYVVLLVNEKAMKKVSGLSVATPLEELAPYGFKEKIRESKTSKKNFVFVLSTAIFSTQALNYIKSKFPNASI